MWVQEVGLVRPAAAALATKEPPGVIQRPDAGPTGEDIEQPEPAAIARGANQLDVRASMLPRLAYRAQRRHGGAG